MTRIAITGSLASGKSTVAKLISGNKYPIFSADKIVKELYKKNFFININKKKFHFKNTKNLKEKVRNLIKNNKKSLKQLELIIHPFVRKEMRNFMRLKKNNKNQIFEIPLLIESKLKKYFDIIIFIKSKRVLRLRRYKSRRGNDKLFFLLDKHQLKDTKKMKLCDHIVVNNKSLGVLKKNLLNIIKLYE